MCSGQHVAISLFAFPLESICLAWLDLAESSSSKSNMYLIWVSAYVQSSSGGGVIFTIFWALKFDFLAVAKLFQFRSHSIKLISIRNEIDGLPFLSGFFKCVWVVRNCSSSSGARAQFRWLPVISFSGTTYKSEVITLLEMRCCWVGEILCHGGGVYKFWRETFLPCSGIGIVLYLNVCFAVGCICFAAETCHVLGEIFRRMTWWEMQNKLLMRILWRKV